MGSAGSAAENMGSTAGNAAGSAGRKKAQKAGAAGGAGGIRRGGRRPRPPRYPGFILEGILLVCVIAYLFYDSPAAAAFLSPGVFLYYRRRSSAKREKDKKELAAQFREALAAIITALKAGYSAENAFCECRREMAFQFGEKAMITEEMRRIERGLENRIPLEKLLAGFALRWEIEEISEFAEVFSIARRSGGNLPEILGRTVSVIQDRMEIDTEIDLLLSSRKYEQKIMNFVPFFIIFYLGISTEGFFEVLYHNAGGVLFMTGCLLVYLLSVLLSDRIMDIEL